MLIDPHQRRIISAGKTVARQPFADFAQLSPLAHQARFTSEAHIE
jgi:hypothetical protein